MRHILTLFQSSAQRPPQFLISHFYFLILRNVCEVEVVAAVLGNIVLAGCKIVAEQHIEHHKGRLCLLRRNTDDAAGFWQVYATGRRFIEFKYFCCQQD